jgi:hypothetical protein
MKEVGGRMDDAVAFIKAFLEDEYQAQVASLTERNYDVLTEKVRKVDSYFRLSSGISSGIGRARFLPESLFSRMRSQVQRLTRRRLFAVVRHDHPDHGPLYRAVCGSAVVGADQKFAEMLYVGDLGEGLRILTRLAVCTTCGGTGAHRGEKCPDCAATGWLHRSGMRFEELGKRAGVLALEAPADEGHKALYEAL